MSDITQSDPDDSVTPDPMIDNADRIGLEQDLSALETEGEVKEDDDGS